MKRTAQVQNVSFPLLSEGKRVSESDSDIIGSMADTMVGTRVAILGAGPAGVGAAWQLVRSRKADAIVVEQRDDVGGNAGSFELYGMPVDYGSHRLHPACQPHS